MKATIIGTDLLKHAESVKILEINSNVKIHNHAADLLDYGILFDMLVSNNILEFHFIYSDNNLHKNGFIFEERIKENCDKFNINYNAHIVSIDDELPFIRDDKDKFILRQAFDNRALVDATYCADKYEFITLMEGSKYLPNSFFYSDTLHHNSLNELDINDSIFPNLIEKHRFDNYDTNELQVLSKYENNEQLNTKKTILDKDRLLQEFLVDVDNIVDNYWSVIRTFNIIYGYNLDTINIGGYLHHSDVSLSFCKNEFEENGIDLTKKTKFRFLNKEMPKSLRPKSTSSKLI